MPVSKNNRKNHKAANARQAKRIQRQRKENSALTILGRGLLKFNTLRDNVRKLANIYVAVTKSIPNYQENDPAVMEGLKLAIPALQKINLQYDALAKRSAELAANPLKDELDYFPEMQMLEHLYMDFSQEFVVNFLPVIDAIERLSDNKGVDTKLLSETRQQLGEIKPTFETKVD